MSQEEDMSGVVTRGALRRRSVDREITPTVASGTPKKVTGGKRTTILDSIQEGEARPGTPHDEEVSTGSRSTRGKRQSESQEVAAAVGNKAIQKVMENEDVSGRRSRNSSLTIENVALLNESLGTGTARMTRRRRMSNDGASTPQKQPPVRRMTRRNSVTSDDASIISLPSATPGAANKSRGLMETTVIEEIDELEKQADASNSSIERSLRSRKVVATDVTPKRVVANSENGSPVVVNTNGSHHSDGDAAPKTPVKTISPQSINSSSSMVNEAPWCLLTKIDTGTSDVTVRTSPVTTTNSPSRTSKLVTNLKNVTFNNQSPDDRTHHTYPKTPITADKKFKLSLKDKGDAPAETLQSTPEMFNDADSEKPLPSQSEVSEKPDDVSKLVDQLVDIVRDINEEINNPDLSVSNPITPVTAKKSQFAHLQAASCSTPINGVPEDTKAEVAVSDDPGDIQSKPLSKTLSPISVNGKEQNSKFSKTWSASVRGSAKDGIDEFSLRKQNEQQKQEAAELKERQQREDSLRAASNVSGLSVSRDKDDDEDYKRNVFGPFDDEAMDVDGYISGASMTAEERRERDDNEIPAQGEDIGSDDTEGDDNENDQYEKDSFIATDDDVMSEGLSCSAESEKPEKKNGKTIKKRRKRIIEPDDDSAEEETIPETPDGEKDKQGEKPKENTPKKNLSVLEANKASPAKTPTIISKTPEKSSLNKSTTEAAMDKMEAKETSTLKSPRKSLLSSSIASPSGKLNATGADAVSPEKSFRNASTTEEELTEQSAPRKSVGANATGLESPSGRKSSLDQSVTSCISISDQSFSPEAIESAKVAQNESPVVEATNQKIRRPLAAMLISTEFYTNAKAPIERPVEEPKSAKKTPKAKKGSLVVANPAAAALAKKIKRQSQQLTEVVEGDKEDPPVDDVEPMEVDEEMAEEEPLELEDDDDSDGQDDSDVNSDDLEGIVEEEDEVQDPSTEASATTPETKVEAQPKKPKAKELSDFNLEAILNRCNEFARVDKERKKTIAAQVQRKKDEKRRLREQQKKATEDIKQEADGDDDEHDDDHEEATTATANADAADDQEVKKKKKKKKKKKVINYMLEELGETKEDVLARALKRREERVEKNRLRKNKKKQAKLAKQLNQENCNPDGTQRPAEGIGAKFSKLQKKHKAAKDVPVAEEVVAPPKEPTVKVALSAFAALRQMQNGELSALQELSKPTNGRHKQSTKRLRKDVSQEEESTGEAAQPLMRSGKLEKEPLPIVPYDESDSFDEQSIEMQPITKALPKALTEKPSTSVQTGEKNSKKRTNELVEHLERPASPTSDGSAELDLSPMLSGQEWSSVLLPRKKKQLLLGSAGSDGNRESGTVFKVKSNHDAEDLGVPKKRKLVVVKLDPVAKNKSKDDSTGLPQKKQHPVETESPQLSSSGSEITFAPQKVKSKKKLQKKHQETADVEDYKFSKKSAKLQEASQEKFLQAKIQENLNLLNRKPQSTDVAKLENGIEHKKKKAKKMSNPIEAEEMQEEDKQLDQLKKFSKKLKPDKLKKKPSPTEDDGDIQAALEEVRQAQKVPQMTKEERRAILGRPKVGESARMMNVERSIQGYLDEIYRTQKQSQNLMVKSKDLFDTKWAMTSSDDYDTKAVKQAKDMKDKREKKKAKITSFEDEYDDMVAPPVRNPSKEKKSQAQKVKKQNNKNAPMSNAAISEDEYGDIQELPKRGEILPPPLGVEKALKVKKHNKKSAAIVEVDYEDDAENLYEEPRGEKQSQVLKGKKQNKIAPVAKTTISEDDYEETPALSQVGKTKKLSKALKTKKQNKNAPVGKTTTAEDDYEEVSALSEITKTKKQSKSLKTKKQIRDTPLMKSATSEDEYDHVQVLTAVATKKKQSKSLKTKKQIRDTPVLKSATSEDDYEDQRESQILKVKKQKKYGGAIDEANEIQKPSLAMKMKSQQKKLPTLSKIATFEKEYEEIYAVLNQELGRRDKQLKKNKNVDEMDYEDTRETLQNTKVKKQKKKKGAAESSDHEDEVRVASKQSVKVIKQKKAVAAEAYVEEEIADRQTLKLSKPLKAKKSKNALGLKSTKLDTDYDDVYAALEELLPTQQKVKKSKSSAPEFEDFGAVHSKAPQRVKYVEADDAVPRKTKKSTKRIQEDEPEPVAEADNVFENFATVPKSLRYRVSQVLPVGHEELRKKGKMMKRSKRSATDGEEPRKTLPLPAWTAAGRFNGIGSEATVGLSKQKKSGGYIPLSTGVEDSGSTHSTKFLLKPLAGVTKNKKKEKSALDLIKANRIDVGMIDPRVVNFKKQAIEGGTGHLRVKKRQ